MGCGRCSLTICWCLLHARGGVSSADLVFRFYLPSSPRPWRCFRPGGREGDDLWVFSTPVEVFLGRKCPGHHPRRLLHARGGVSGYVTDRDGEELSSPRPWRCFRKFVYPAQRRAVFSTPVAVFLREVFTYKCTSSLLHARGGVSHFRGGWVGCPLSSPRPWRCF